MALPARATSHPAAAPGTHLDLPTLEADRPDPEDGSITVPLDVIAGTQSGDTLTVRGYGVPRLRGPGRGDLKVQVIVETPSRVDEEQRALLEQLAKLQDDVDPIPVADIIQIVEEELGGRISQLFAEFADEPLGVASLGRVHAAEPRAGRPGVATVQPPHIMDVPTAACSGERRSGKGVRAGVRGSGQRVGAVRERRYGGGARRRDRAELARNGKGDRRRQWLGNTGRRRRELR